MASLRVRESGDASAVSHGETGPAREPWPLYAVANWTRQGTDGFLGHERCQGQTSGRAARRHGALILMGVWCGAHTADTARKKTGMRLQLPGGASVPGGTPRKTVVKSGVRGGIAS